MPCFAPQAQAFKMVVLALIHLNGGHIEEGASHLPDRRPRPARPSRARHGRLHHHPGDKIRNAALTNAPSPPQAPSPPPPPHTHTEDLWRHLEQLGVERTATEHPQFGRPDELLKDLATTRCVCVCVCVFVCSYVHLCIGLEARLPWLAYP